MDVKKLEEEVTDLSEYNGNLHYTNNVLARRMLQWQKYDKHYYKEMVQEDSLK